MLCRLMVPLRTSESDPFPVAIAVGHDNARAIGTDGEDLMAGSVPGSTAARQSAHHPKIPARPLSARGVASSVRIFRPRLLHWAQHSQNDNPATGEKRVKSSDPVAAG